ncbi:MAG: thioredoxin family protein [Candidatus Portiera sp.]|nr:thioredoxin family protein [Portiera sp.]
MVETNSTMMPLGTQAPQWQLPDSVSGNLLSLQELTGTKATLIMFICNHCPFVKHLQEGLVQLADDYKGQGIALIAISSNDADNYPQDGPAKMKEEAIAQGYDFPYLYDETQQVAKDYNAVCTPDFFIFDGNLSCAYRGQFDDSRPNNGLAVTGKDLRDAFDALVAGQQVNPEQKPSTGCNIKWK